MNNVRKIVKEALKEAYYTTWKKIEEGSPSDAFKGTETEIASKLAKKLKLGKFFPLGSGTGGFAYHIPNNKVLKITKDKTEASEAFKIKGKNLKHLADIYEVYELRGKYQGTYVIISELLDKTDDIDIAEDVLFNYAKQVLNTYHQDSIFLDYSFGKLKGPGVTKMINSIYEWGEQEDVNPSEIEIAIWYFKGMIGVIDEMKKYNILSKDWGAHNLGIKKNGQLAMYDLGYGDPEVPKGINNIHLNEKQLEEFWSADEYPQFDDGQFNPIFHNRPSLPVMNMNTAPMREAEMSQEEVDVQLLPLEYHYMFDDFVTYTTEPEIREIAPSLDLNRNTKDIVLDIKKNYPSLYDNFAEWISDRLNKS